MTARAVFYSLVFAVVAGAGFFASSPAAAQGGTLSCCSCVANVATPDHDLWFEKEGATVPVVQSHIESEITGFKMWLAGMFWEDNLLPAMMLMADQLSAVAAQQMMIIGTFFDAKHQLETQQSLQKINARAHKDYEPSVGMCEFGSSAKSLAASERKSEYNALAMSQQAQDRELGSRNTAAAIGQSADRLSRIRQFREKFCDPKDNNNGLYLMCKNADDSVGAADPARMNKDIDYLRTVDAKWTLDIDFSDETLTEAEEEVLALASNLYAHDIFLRPPSKGLESVDGRQLNDLQQYYMDARAVVAKRAVARTSFEAITAMKSAGLPGSKDYLKAVLAELGLENSSADPETIAILGENPSYYAQMEILTKKIYQNPDFYTNLYDKPANVERKGVALQAIGLMQKFDLFKSYLRQEASLSVLLELAVIDLQTEVENDIAKSEAGGAVQQ